uniref:Uncharacterized protein LOC111136909 n=1 Tax=Crassostrea virginica TaxID=6565 RepID=A0A8B8EUY9_CRAVI|nr:uncharacterized protein LOC111136909 [Crassostrea virginica]
MSHPAARSVHLWFDLPRNAKCVCNEVCVSESQRGSYFCVIGFSRGYSGIQELGNGKKMAIFSVWDSDSNTDPSEEHRVQVTSSGEGVEVSRFGNEGTGGKSMMPLEWKLGEPVHFKMEASDLDGVWTAYSCYLKNGLSDWFHMATMKTIANGELLNGVYSFVEDFRRDGASHCETRSAKFGDCYSLDGGCQNNCKKATFTADSTTPTLNINAGLCDNKFYLTTGGPTENSDTPLNCCIVKSPE